MKMLPAVQNSPGIFRHLFIERFHAGTISGRLHRVHRTGTDTTSAANTFIQIDMRFFIFDDRRTMRTDPHAGTAADTFAFTDMRFAVMVHFHFAGTRTAAHTDIFNSAAETSSFVTFKMVQGNHDIRIHQCFAYFRFLHQFAARHSYISFVSTLQAVGNNNVTAC